MSDASPPRPGSAADDDDALRIAPGRFIPRSELTARATRAGGAGGQHVNTSSTRIELLWDPARSAALRDEERIRVLEKLAARLDAEGQVRIVASDTRSQRQNRALAEQRLAELVRRALVVPRKRRATKPSRGAKERRLEEKRRDSQKKRQRRTGDWE